MNRSNSNFSASRWLIGLLVLATQAFALMDNPSSEQLVINEVSVNGESATLEMASFSSGEEPSLKTQITERDGIPRLAVWVMGLQSHFMANPAKLGKSDVSKGSGKILAAKLRSIALKLALEEKKWSLSARTRALAQQVDGRGQRLTHGWIAENLNPWFREVFASQKYAVKTFESKTVLADIQSSLLDSETQNPILKTQLEQFIACLPDKPISKSVPQLAATGFPVPPHRTALKISVSPAVLKKIQ